MNEKLLELDKNKYLMIEENNNVSIVETDNNLKEILNIEDDIKNEQDIYNSICRKIDDFKLLKQKKKYSNRFLLVSEILYILSVLLLPTNLIFSLLLGLGILITGKTLIALFHGKDTTLDKKIYELELKKNVSQAKIDSNEILLDIIKKNNNYKKESIVDHINERYYVEKEQENKNTKEIKKLVLKPEYKNDKNLND